MNCHLRVKLNQRQLTQKPLFVELMQFNKKILTCNSK